MKIKKELTDFEWQVLKAALTIPLGETRSYQWIARRIGKPKAVRAVGQALRKNPYPLIIPCHRVIKSDGTPGGYAGQMDGKKAKLLDMEQIIVRRIKAARRL
ncbi:MAG: MGMT family protein [Candidatus Omnitrophica bacterium]|nr:MGMT family protein [Candidatus Omnitrophota bacterium]